jgi:uncharacterized protein (TIGR04255 family)
MELTVVLRNEVRNEIKALLAIFVICSRDRPAERQMPNYKRPPIIEAVVEVRVGGAALDDKVMDLLTKRFAERYPAPPQPSNNLGVEVSGATLRVMQQNLGFKIHSADGGYTVNVGRNALGTSRNPPYEGWDDFMEQARANWSDWEKVVGWKDIIRIGVRYINRIDIPFGPTGITQLEEYFNFNANVPDLGPLSNFAISAEIQMTEKPLRVVINHAPTPSPLVQHNSFLLDLDLALEKALPTNKKALWETVEGLRSLKNFIFEACITDRTRELFSP